MSPASADERGCRGKCVAVEKYDVNNPRILRLYGKSYDATRWAASHPGGSSVIESASMLDETVTERLFESSHRDPEKNLRRLESFMLAESPRCSSKLPASEEPALIRPDEFRDVRSIQRPVAHIQCSQSLRRQVYNYLSQQYPNNPRGQGKTYALLKCAGSGLLWLFFLFDTFAKAKQPATYVCWTAVLLRAFGAGFVLIMWGLTQFHDASHYAFAGGVCVNKRLAATWGAVAYWPPWMWHKHHVERHHTCTGDYQRDPDLRHGAPFMRKTAAAPKNRYIGISPLMQLAAMLIAPGMYFGQSFHYTLVRFGVKKNLWKMSGLVPDEHGIVSNWEISLYIWFPLWIGALWQRAGPALALAAGASYIIAANVAYAANILPDHDTDASHANLAALERLSAHPDGAKRALAHSWTAKQAAASANWGGRIWCFFFGGINYQIEHHLFPRVHHSLYPEIAPIVAATCANYGVPYVHYTSINAAAWAVYRQILQANHDISHTF